MHAPKTLVATLFAALTLEATAATMTVSSDSFPDGGTIPALEADSARCNGRDISPQVSWHDLPRGARSVVVTLTDQGDRPGRERVLWLAYDIPAERGELRKGEGDKTDVGVVVGRNSAGSAAYHGMCPPAGESHRYVVTVVASDLAPDALAAGLDRDAVLAAQSGHVLDSGSMTGVFGR